MSDLIESQFFDVVEVPETTPKEKANGTPKRKTAFRFNAAADVDLLKEVIVEEPYQAPHGTTSKKWEQISVKLGAKFSAETARKRFQTLLAEFKKEDRNQIKGSGTDEEYDERWQLLQDVSDRIQDSAAKKTVKRDTGDAKAAEIRDEAMRSLKSKAKGVDDGDEEEEAPKKKAKISRQDRLLDLMEEEIKMKIQQQQIEENRLKLEEKKLNLEEEKWKAEKEEKKALLDLLKNK